MNEKEVIYPETYLHVLECRSGETWIIPIDDDAPIDLRVNLNKWIATEFAGEFALDGKIIPKLEGDYYAQIITDGRPPDGGICWDAGGFYLK